VWKITCSNVIRSQVLVLHYPWGNIEYSNIRLATVKSALRDHVAINPEDIDENKVV
jgi:hypothetical protein